METSPSSEFTVHFWGVRGSIPSPGKDTVRYGGNTSCIELRIAGKSLIFDGGTGLRMLGKCLQHLPPIDAYWFFTHYHWDHIQGVPFFHPLFVGGNNLQIYGAAPNQSPMEQHFKEHVLHLNSPVPTREIRADLKFHDLVCGEGMTLGDITIETGPLNHPNGAMGYRISWQGHSVVYCTDTEHFPDRLDENIMKLARDADILIYDAMYTDEQYYDPKSPKVGWGHSTWQEGVKLSKAAGVKHLAVFHHEPNHTDDMLDRIGVELQETFEGGFMAREGMIFQVI